MATNFTHIIFIRIWLNFLEAAHCDGKLARIGYVKHVLGRRCVVKATLNDLCLPLLLTR
jgi:hypothetical protein